MVAGGKKRIVITAVSAVLLVAMVVAGVVVAVTQFKKNDQENGNNRDSKSGGNVAQVSKAISAICHTTHYKEECQKSLSKVAGDKSEPQDLIKASFQVAVHKLREALKNSRILTSLAKDPMTKQALNICTDMMHASLADLKSSFDRMGVVNIEKVNDYVEDVRVWLSGAVAHQGTCIDAFQNTTGEAGKKMLAYLKPAQELTSNGLAMVTETAGVFDSLNLQASRRRLLTSSSPSTNKNINNQQPPGKRMYQVLPAWISKRKVDLLTATPNSLKPNATVAKDGSGKYKTINDALKQVPKKNNGSSSLFVIYVKEGVYNEQVTIGRMMKNVVMIGDGPTKTRITGNKNFAGGTKTMYTATVAVIGDFFIAKDIGFENTAGAKGHQAVALRVQSDFSIFYNCSIDGYQDTLYVQTYRHYFRDCTITGTIDFIFGDGLSLFQNCKIVVRKPLENQACMVTAQGRGDKHEITAIVLQNCTISGDAEYIPNKDKNKAYLGRPWKEFARTIVMQSQIDDTIQPAGYVEWDKQTFHNTAFFGEYNNRGPGADMSQRSKWPSIKKLPPNQAEEFNGGKWLEGDDWIKPSGVPFASGLMKV